MKNWISVLLGGILLVALFAFMDIGSVYRNLLKVSPSFLAASILSNFLFFLLRAARWKLLLVPVKNSVSVSNTFWLTAVGYFANTVAPTRLGGEIARAYLMDKKEKIGFGEGLSSVGLERLLDLLAISVLAMIGSALLPQTASPLYINLISIVFVVVFAGFAAVTVAVKKEEKVLDFLKQLIARVPIIKRKSDSILKFFRSVVKGARIIEDRPKLFLSSVILSVAIWLTTFGGFLLLFQAFHIAVLPQAILLGSMLFMLTAILPAPPGYVGFYELFWTLIFLGFDIPQESVLAVGFVNHSIYLVVVLGLGLVGISKLGSSFAEVMALRRASKAEVAGR